MGVKQRFFSGAESLAEQSLHGSQNMAGVLIECISCWGFVQLYITALVIASYT